MWRRHVGEPLQPDGQNPAGQDRGPMSHHALAFRAVDDSLLPPGLGPRGSLDVPGVLVLWRAADANRRRKFGGEVSARADHQYLRAHRNDVVLLVLRVLAR